MMRSISALLLVTLLSCSKEEDHSSRIIEFEDPVDVTVIGYSDHIMEPFLSRDGSILLFNNSNDPIEDTKLHWSTKVNETTFTYRGEVSNINTPDLEAVATMDVNNNLFFVTTRDYFTTLVTLYQTVFTSGSAGALIPLSALSLQIVGWLNFDVEVTADGQHLYFADGRYDQNGGPHEANLAIAEKNGNQFIRKTDQSALQNINTMDLEYAAAISQDELELYFTRIMAPINIFSISSLYYATRANPDEPFGIPRKIENATGFVEAVTLAGDGSIYFHKKVNGFFILKYMKRKN